MKNRLTLTLKFVKNKTLWLPALFFSVIPTLAVYTHNINLLSLDRLLLPITYAMFFAILSGCVAFTIFKSEKKASVFTAIWAIFFFSFGYLVLILGNVNVFANLPIGLNNILFSFYVFVLFLICLALYKIKSVNYLYKILLLVSCLIVVFNFLKIAPVEFKRILNEEKLKDYTSKKLDFSNIKANTEFKPDIYFFVFDRYGREDVLLQYFGFNNIDQTEYLKSNGFWVGEKSYANYPNTFLSLSSTLNVTYLDFLTPIMGKNNVDQVNVNRQLLQKNQVSLFLKSNGYKHILLGSSWDPLKKSMVADENYNLLSNFDEFQLYIYERTLLNYLRGIFENKTLYTGTELFNKINLNLDFRLHRLNRQKNQPQPVFVFGHFLLPHPPYVFSPECDAYQLSTSSQQIPENGYINEIMCANIVMQSIVKEITQKNGRPSVVIFQSDEGPYLPLKYFNGDGESVPDDPESYFIHGAILNAVFMPDKKNPSKPADYEKIGFHDNISPVNTLRTIFNYYFETDLEIYPDKTFFSQDNYHFYDFKEVTDLYSLTKNE